MRLFWCIVFFLFLYDSNLFASNKATNVAAHNYENFVLITRLDPKLDFVHKTVSATISLKSVSKVYRNEMLSVIGCSINVADENKDYFIEDELLLVFPNGEVRVLDATARHTGKLQNNNPTFWRGAFVVSFDNSYPLGQYMLVYRSLNLKTGVERTALRNFTLSDWTGENISPIAEEKDFWNAIKMYYTDQSPELLLKIFNSPHCKILTDKNNSVNYTIFVFLREAFRKKTFLFDVLAKDFDLAENVKRINSIILFSSLGETYRLREKVMTSEEKTLSEEAFKIFLSLISPYENKPSNGYQEMLWGEFYAKGNYAPIECLLNCLADVDDAKNFVESIKIGKSIDDIEPEKLFVSVRCISSLYSIMRNTDVKLAMNYIDFFAQENAKKYPPAKISSSFSIVNDYLNLRLNQKKNKKIDKAK